MVLEYLTDYFNKIYVAKDGVQALEHYLLYAPDIIITDIKMPKKNGLELTRKIRQENKKIPIIITTAYTDTEYLLEAVELQLVKYLLKPIDEKKLQEALISAFENLNYSYGTNIQLTKIYHFEMFNKVLTKDDNIIPLSKKQTDFLYLLLQHAQQSVSYEKIQYHVWKDKIMSDSALRSLVYDLRKIIDKNIIENVSKTGYKINIDG
ncbi:MAG: Putative two-component response regulator [uncultured Sulfurovum sp.]|uniref:Two-component response regulator n=1 Tax=uncultured Sulfurovum sp. TaxID=269237 RepID=A0A6S6TBZ7_9BACT|nr:MAG: Putative two-component response regulator [uncultured Sulfurovum sp.]